MLARIIRRTGLIGVRGVGRRLVVGVTSTKSLYEKKKNLYQAQTGEILKSEASGFGS